MVDRSEYVVAHDRHDKWEVHLFPDLATAESDLWDWTYEEYEALRSQIGSITNAGQCVFPGVIDFSIFGPNYFDSVPNGYKGYNTITKRLKPITIKSDVDTINMFPSLSKVNGDIAKLTLPIYSPMLYLLPTRVKEYEEKSFSNSFKSLLYNS